MTQNNSDKPLDPLRKAQEDEYFVRQNRELASKLKAKMALQSSGVQDNALREELTKAGFSSDTLSLLFLVPIVDVAWADRRMEDKEKKEILHVAEQRGVSAGSTSAKILNRWLSENPQNDIDYVKCKKFVDVFLKEIEKNTPGAAGWVLDAATAVANATGGVLGFGSRISAAESDALKALASKFAK